jgi:hypothetical protein
MEVLGSVLGWYIDYYPDRLSSVIFRSPFR